MFAPTIPVAQRIAALKNIFIEFGIPVPDNSILEQTIKAEFGPGKRSQITPIIAKLHAETDAALLARCIGTALVKGTTDPQLLAVGSVLQNQLPHLLTIIDIRQQTSKREHCLSQILLHFQAKIAPDPRTERLLRMLNAASNRLHLRLQVTAVGLVLEHTGVAFTRADLQRAGKILQAVTPALLALNDPTVLHEQKMHYSLHALRVLAAQLQITNLTIAANIIDHVHWLAKVTLPEIADRATIEQALQNLGVSLGGVAGLQLRAKARELGLTEKEIIQLIYANIDNSKLAPNDQELLLQTKNNQQFAAVCGYMAKLGQEIGCQEVEKIGIGGMCLAAMRQTFVELKTGNLTAASFSESLGLILAGVGTISNQPKLAYIGESIIAGVQAYSGLMAVPGGAAVAIPVAVCAVLGKFLLRAKESTAQSPEPNPHMLWAAVLQQIVVVQHMLQQHFAHLFAQLQTLYHDLIFAMEQGFVNLTCLLQTQHLQTLAAAGLISQKIDALQAHIDHEFTGLYMEYLREPVDEIDFARRYGCKDPARLQQNKHKLAMWLLYKAKHPKVNGVGGLANHAHTPELASYFLTLLQRDSDPEANLGLVHRYLHLALKSELVEDLPHAPSWLAAARLYIFLLSEYGLYENSTMELHIINDIMAIAGSFCIYLSKLAIDLQFWQTLATRAIKQVDLIEARLALHKPADKCWKDISALLQTKIELTPVLAARAEHDQLEHFTNVNVDISSFWQQYFDSAIPNEIKVAQQLKLGSIITTFCVEPRVNHFATVHLPANEQELPASARVVIFKIEISFKPAVIDSPQHLLLSSWFGYDLVTGRQRFDEYYNLKFKYALKHRDYHWISIDGRRNQVAGYGDTDTHKLIDYDRLAKIYQDWLTKALPINHVQLLPLIAQNPSFVVAYPTLVSNKQFMHIQHTHIAFVRVLVQSQAREFYFKARVNFANQLQQDQICMPACQQYDALIAAMQILLKLINLQYPRPFLCANLQALITDLRDPNKMDNDLSTRLQSVSFIPAIKFFLEVRYTEGEFYRKLQYVIAALSLLRTSLANDDAVLETDSTLVATQNSYRLMPNG